METQNQTIEQKRSKYKANAWIILIFTFIFIFVAIKVVNYSNDISRKTPEKAIASVFGVYDNTKQSNSGAWNLQSINNTYEICYNFYPLTDDFYEHSAIDLSDKIRTLYKNNKINRIIIHYYGPFKDAYGKIEWKPVFSLTFNRDIYNKINWDHFDYSQIFIVCENLKQYIK